MVLKMTWIQNLVCLWFVTQAGFANGEIEFLERQVGDSVVLSCEAEQSIPPPFGVYLKRRWLRTYNVLFKYSGSEFAAEDEADKRRISVSGDPSSHSVNVTISELRLGDTDRYHCEFMVTKESSPDVKKPGKTEFFLLVTADAPGKEDVGLVETCAGTSAVIPCFPPHGDSSVVEGVSLKRQKGHGPVEVLYHSKHHLGGSPASSSHFPAERVQLSSAPGPEGMTYNLTLQQLQPEDSAMYSCQLLLRGRPDSSTSLGRRVFFVSVQGQCGCSSYSTLLYALSSAVAFLLLLVLLGFVLIYKGKTRRAVKAQPQTAIYEEMVGVKPLNRKLAPQHQEETESSEYRNCQRKKSCPENYYESPRGAHSPRKDSQPEVPGIIN